MLINLINRHFSSDDPPQEQETLSAIKVSLQTNYEHQPIKKPLENTNPCTF